MFDNIDLSFTNVEAEAWLALALVINANGRDLCGCTRPRWCLRIQGHTGPHIWFGHSAGVFVFDIWHKGQLTCQRFSVPLPKSLSWAVPFLSEVGVAKGV